MCLHPELLRNPTRKVSHEAYVNGRVRPPHAATKARARLLGQLAMILLAWNCSGPSVNAQNTTASDAPWQFQAMKKPQALAVDSKDTLMSTETREAVQAAISRKTAAAGQQVTSPLIQTLFGQTLFVLNVEFSDEAARQKFHAPGATVIAAAGPYAEMFVEPTEEAVNAVKAAPGIRRIEPEAPVRVPPPPTLTFGVAARGLAEPVVSGGISGLTGRGAIVAIVDSGLDFRNPDFVDMTTGRPMSRLLYFWDTMSDAFEAKGLGTRPPINYPNGRPIGTLYTRSQLTTDLRQLAILRRIPTPDENGHGTAAAGLAAGNGANSPPDDRHLGVAPDADIIAVRIGDANGTMPEGYLLNAIIDWIDKVAREAHEPAVVSCSFGGHFTGHDGQTIEERHLSSRFNPDAVGRAIVISAGNERGDAVHAKMKIGGIFAPGLLGWKVRGSATIRIFLRPSNPVTFKPEDISYDEVKVAPPGLSSLLAPQQATAIQRVSPADKNPITGEWQLTIKVANGPGGLELYSTTGAAVQADAYLVDAPMTGVFLENLKSGSNSVPVAFHGEQITSPGTALNAITVGSYDWTDQFDGKARTGCELPINPSSLSCYSNSGFSRSTSILGLPIVKPEIAAPGQIFTTSYARTTDGRGVNETLPKINGEAYWNVDKSGRYVAFDGTSASAPYVAGIVALMMQKKPNITAGEIKSLLLRHASHDSETGSVPNPAWGFGKLDVAAVRAILNEIR
jgi:subtilisin family serine protease